MSIVRVCGKTRHKDTPFLLLGVHLFAFLVVCKNYASTSLSCLIVNYHYLTTSMQPA